MKTVLLLICSLLTLSLCAQQKKGVTPVNKNKTQSHYPDQPSGDIRAVVVGISDYQSEDIPDLRFADKDAEAFAGFFLKQHRGGLELPRC